MAYASFQELLLAEGDAMTRYGNTPLASPVHWSGSEDGGGVPLAATAALPVIGKAAVVQSIIASCNVPILAQIDVTGDAAGRFGGTPFRVQIGAQQPVSVPMTTVQRGFQVTNGVVSLRVVRAYDAAPTTVDLWGSISASGWTITADFDWSAPKTVLFVGDSIFNGTGVTRTSEMLPWLLKAYWLSRKVRTRIVLKSASGSTTGDHATWVTQGYHDITPPDLVIYEVGTNDCGNYLSAGQVAPATYVANIAAWWARQSLLWPKAKMIVTSPPPRGAAAPEAQAVLLRAALAVWVASQNSSRLAYIDLGTAFDRTNTSFFAASDAANDRVHWSAAGHAAVATVMQTTLPGLGLAAA